ncbi:MAG TPA: hypothetical protein VG318_16615 [Actinomycetota bacterium]|nr:hypothetical protein [Actinomycetota bacterium]
MDLSLGTPAIDVAVGMMFLFFLLSVICSQVNELVATALNFRAGELKRGIGKLVGEDVKNRIMSDPLVTSLKKRARRDPTYIGSRTFVLALLGTPEAVGNAKTAIEGLPRSNPARDPLLRLAADVGDDIDDLKKAIEDWYDEAMGHVSGWYRRRVQRWLLLYATILTLGMNVDAGLIARTLWTDDAVRSAVVAAAANAEDPNGGDVGGTELDLDAIAKDVEGVKGLGLPVGWTDDAADPRAWPGWDGGEKLVWRLLGWLLTIIALSLGAPFWFDLLGKVSRLRQTGVAPADNAKIGKER